MNTYELKEPTVQAGKITGIAYTIDDGSTKPDTTDGQSVIGSYYVIQPDGTTTIVAAADFEAKYQPVAG